MLEKLLGAGSCGGSISHLTCRQAILLASLGGSTSLLWLKLLPLHSWGVGH